jgi:uncharacterized protein YecE (DUF72 family)
MGKAFTHFLETMLQLDNYLGPVFLQVSPILTDKQIDSFIHLLEIKTIACEMDIELRHA